MVVTIVCFWNRYCMSECMKFVKNFNGKKKIIDRNQFLTQLKYSSFKKRTKSKIKTMIEN